MSAYPAMPSAPPMGGSMDGLQFIDSGGLSDRRPMSPGRPPSRGGLGGEAAPVIMMPALMRPMSPDAARMPLLSPPPHFTSPRMAPQMAAPGVEPMARAPEIRGVGIKFGERLDPTTGAIKVYVKRIVQNGPAHQAGSISPGDILVVLDGEQACSPSQMNTRHAPSLSFCSVVLRG